MRSLRERPELWVVVLLSLGFLACHVGITLAPTSRGSCERLMTSRGTSVWKDVELGRAGVIPGHRGSESSVPSTAPLAAGVHPQALVPGLGFHSGGHCDGGYMEEPAPGVRALWVEPPSEQGAPGWGL